VGSGATGDVVFCSRCSQSRFALDFQAFYMSKILQPNSLGPPIVEINSLKNLKLRFTCARAVTIACSPMQSHRQ
jgi:hypothetical protein